MRQIVVLTLILVSAKIATAQMNVFFGYSYYNTTLNGNRNSLNGWEGSLEGKFLPFIGVVADFDAHYGSENFRACNGFDCVLLSGAVTQNNYLFGPRVSVSVGKFRPFAHVLIGASHANIHHVTSDTSFASAVGGGIDYKFLRLLAWRFQGDYIHSSLFNQHENNFRLSTGLVLRF